MFDNSSTVVLNNKTVSSIMQGSNVLYQKQTSGCTYLIQLSTRGITVSDSQRNPVPVINDTFQGVCGETYSFHQTGYDDRILTVRTDNVQGYYDVVCLKIPNVKVIHIEFIEEEAPL